jgi:hypothetical protein
MNSGLDDWRRERRELPPQLIAEAAANPGGSVAEIDGSKVSDPDGYVPAEAIRGVYEIGPDGRGTGYFLHNPRFGPVRDDFGRLDDPGHWLGWLPGTPAEAIRSELTSMIAGQVAGAIVEWVKVVEPPAYLTAGRRMPDNADSLIVTRAALAAPLALAAVVPSGQREILLGVFTWVAAGLDNPEARRDRTWLDLGMRRDQAEELLQRRIFELDQPAG